MLSLASVSVEMGVSYFKDDDYYNESAGDELGKAVFSGTGAKLLGIEREVDQHTFENLLEGMTPDGKRELIKAKRILINPEDLAKKTKKLRTSLEKIGLTDHQEMYIKSQFSSHLFGKKSDDFDKFWNADSQSFKGQIYAVSRDERHELRAILSHCVREWKLPSEKKEKLRKTLQTYLEYVGRSGHRGGVDATFSAPKSISIAALIGGNKQLIEAHNKAVEYALNQLEEKTAGTRVNSGERRVFQNTNNLIAAKFNHGTSREGDPQLHTHCVIFNMTQRKDGAWRSFYSDVLFENSKLLGVVYQNKLAELTQKLGYEIETKSNGTFEISGYSEELVLSFSKRRTQVLESSSRQIFESILKESLSEKGFDTSSVVRGGKRFFAVSGDKESIEKAGFKIQKSEASIHYINDFIGDKSFESQKEYLLAKVTQKHNRQGVLLDRSLKDDTNTANLKERWQSEFAIFSASHPQTNGKNFEWGKLLDTSYAVDHLSERDAVFSSSKLETESIIRNLGKRSYEEIQQAVRSNINIVKIDTNTENNRAQYATLQELSKEEAILRIMKEGRSLFREIGSENMARDIAETKGYTNGQREALTLSLCSKDQFMAWVGVAGSGKSFALKDLKEIAESNGYKLTALGPDASTAKQLSCSIEAKGMTVDKYLTIPSEKVLSGKNLLIIDESSKLSTENCYRLLERVKSANSRIIFVGDHEQLGSVKAGNPFYLMASSGIAKAELKEHRRQNTPELKQIVEAARDTPQLSVELLKASIMERKTKEARYNKVANEYLSLSSSVREKTIILSNTNADRLDLTHKIREKLRANGDLSAKEEIIEVLRSKGLSQAQKRLLWNYKKDDIVIFENEPKKQFLVEKIDKKNAHVSLKDIEGNIIKNRPSQMENAEVYTSEKIAIAGGDVLQWRRNFDGKINREIVKVKDLSQNQATLICENGRQEKIDLKHRHHLDYAHVQTTYSSQGRTCDRVIALVESHTSKNDWYVSLSRAKEQVTIVTDSADELKKRVERESSKANALLAIKEKQGWEKAVKHPQSEKELILPSTRKLAMDLLEVRSIEQRKIILAKIVTSENACEYSSQIPSERRFSYQKNAEALIKLGDFSDQSMKGLICEISKVPAGVRGREPELTGKQREEKFKNLVFVKEHSKVMEQSHQLNL